MILVEGYMDVIGIWQAGIQNAVASCGTSLTNEQVRTIKRQIAHTDASVGQVIVNFDPDPGGARGTERSIHLLLAESLRVKILNLPGDADPDEFIQQFGSEGYLQLVERAPSYFHWLIDRSKERFDVSTAEGRVSALQSLWPALGRVHDKIERNALLEDVAGRFRVDVQLIRDHFRQSQPNAAKLKRVVEISSSVPPNERLLLSSMLHSEEARVAALHYIEQSDCSASLELKNVFKAMMELHRAGAQFSIMALLDRLEDREQKIVSELSFQHISAQEQQPAGQAIHCLRALELKNAEGNRTALKVRIRDAEHRGDMAEALRLTAELKQMERSPRISRAN
jgi:DNA primase